jgi:hypothetical protein
MFGFNPCSGSFVTYERTTDKQATGKLYHMRLRVECTLFCNLQRRARTHAVLVIGLYELLDNPTTQLIEPPRGCQLTFIERKAENPQETIELSEEQPKPADIK